MAETAAAPEPTMEEILASIRKIISEEDQPAEEAAAQPAPAAPAAEAEEEVIELTQMVEDDSDPTDFAAPVMQDDEPEEDLPKLISARTEQAGVAAFTDLIHAVQGPWPLGDGAKTVESMVLELLKPLLKEWLDLHLPGLVEELVRHEIEQMVRRARPDMFKRS
jgi:uncharacterized protein